MEEEMKKIIKKYGLHIRASGHQIASTASLRAIDKKDNILIGKNKAKIMTILKVMKKEIEKKQTFFVSVFKKMETSVSADGQKVSIGKWYHSSMEDNGKVEWDMGFGMIALDSYFFTESQIIMAIGNIQEINRDDLESLLREKYDIVGLKKRLVDAAKRERILSYYED